jgi:FeS assembly SUF system protein
MEEAAATQEKNSQQQKAEAPGPPLSVSEAILMQDKIVEVLKGCYDPEIPVNIYDLGLIYDVKVDTAGVADIKMTLTAPNCPAAGMLPAEIEYKVREIPGIKDVRLELVWEPPWEPSKMSEAARLQLGMW